MISKFGFLAAVSATVTVATLFPLPSFGFVTWQETNGDVVWGNDKSDKNPLNDFAPPEVGASLFFCWTKGQFDPITKSAVCHNNYEPFFIRNITNKRLPFKFFRPQDNTITDWAQLIKDKNDRTTKVYGGNIKPGSPFEFRPLSELPNIPYRIPDLAPFEGTSGLTIYTAVNLDIYLSSNPNGFLDGNWSVGQTLDELGISIVDGQIAGVEGIYFATSDFTFDPNSATGFVPIDGDTAWLNSSDFQSINGNIGILAEHEGIPIPEKNSPLSLLALGTLGAASALKRKLKPTKSEKETEKVG